MKKCRFVRFFGTWIVVKATSLLCGTGDDARQTIEGTEPRIRGLGRRGEQIQKSCNQPTHDAPSDSTVGHLSLAARDAAVKWRAALLLVAALAHNPGAVADIGSTTWCELITPDFHLISDLDEAGLRELLSLLYQFGPLADPYLPGEPVARQDALKVIVFSSRGDFRRLTGKRKFAAFMQPSLQTNRLLIGPMRGSLTETTLHEYAHYLLRNRLDVSLPMWFDEGLASLLGEVEFDAGEAIVGLLPVDRMLAGMDSVPEQESPFPACPEHFPRPR